MLAQNPCRARCAWLPQPRSRSALPVFHCSGCGSQWSRTQSWTPMDADGTVSAEVRAEAARRADAADSADS